MSGYWRMTDEETRDWENSEGENDEEGVDE